MKQCTAWIALRELGDAQSLLPEVERLRWQTCPWWLDSSLSDGERGRFSFAGADPYLVCRVRERKAVFEVRRCVRSDLPQESCTLAMDPFELLRSVQPANVQCDAMASQFPFVGGAVGYLSYELARHLEALPLFIDSRSDFAELCLLFVDRVLIFDHRKKKLFASGVGFGATLAEAQQAAELRIEDISIARSGSLPRSQNETLMSVDSKSCQKAKASQVFVGMDAKRHAQEVSRIRNCIAVGDLYQACLTYAIAVPCLQDPWSLYLALREKNPAPFSAFVQLPEGSILCSSPERFLRLNTVREVESRPIKGTRPRGKTHAEDALLCDELQNSEKDRAENLMIADLVRNDFGRVCEFGSVDAVELMQVESYANLFQMVSSIRGRLRKDCSATDLLRAVFPPGSMTGAPKIAAMRLLADCETQARGVYSGALGYFDLRGGLDLAVVIRTILLSQGVARVQTGGGIVADSVPSEEYQESRDKAQALLAVLGVAIPK